MSTNNMQLMPNNGTHPINTIVLLNSFDILQINSLSAPDNHWIKFHPDGNIEIYGDAYKASEYIIAQCWELFNNPSKYGVLSKSNMTITIFEYFIIDLNSKTITNKVNNSVGFYQLQEVIEREVFRKLKLIAFW